MDGVKIKEGGDHGSDDGATFGGKCPERDNRFCPDGFPFEIDFQGSYQQESVSLQRVAGNWSLEETCCLRPNGARYQSDISLIYDSGGLLNFASQRICLPRLDDNFLFKMQQTGVTPVTSYTLKLNGIVVHRSDAPSLEEEAPVFGYGCPDLPPVTVDVGAVGDRYVPRPARFDALDSFTAFAGRECVDAAADLADTYGRTPQQCAQVRAER